MAVYISGPMNSATAARNKNILLTDVVAAKKDELERRKKLRILQVRQQSKDLANSLREKVRNDQECRQQLLDNQKKAALKQWQQRQLSNLQQKYADCLADVGQAHNLAAIQENADEVLTSRRLYNENCAAVRGARAVERLQQECKDKFERTTAPLIQKKAVRAKEDLRANLVAALPQPKPRVAVNASKKFSPVKKKVACKSKKRGQPVVQEIPSNISISMPRNGCHCGVKCSSDKKCLQRDVEEDEEDNDEVENTDPSKHCCNCSGSKCCKKDEQIRHEPPKKVGRRRRYSENDCVSDESFDSDVTWPPRSPHTSATTQVEFYDHNNRFRNNSARLKQTAFVSREEPNTKRNFGPDLERIAVEKKCSRDEILNKKQMRRCNKAANRQRLKQDFQELLCELGRLDQKERKLRCSTYDHSKDNICVSEAERKERLAAQQKKMEAALCEASILAQTNQQLTDEIIEDPVQNSSLDETPKLNVGNLKSQDKKLDARVDTTIKESDTLNQNRLNLRDLMERINRQRELLYEEVKKESPHKEKQDRRRSHSPVKRIDEQVSSCSQKKISPCRARKEQTKFLETVENSPGRRSTSPCQVQRSPKKVSTFLEPDEEEFNSHEKKIQISPVRSPKKAPQVEEVFQEERNKCSFMNTKEKCKKNKKNLFLDTRLPDCATEEQKCLVVDKVDKSCRTKNNNSDSTDSSTTLYSLDMALSQMSMDSNQDVSSTFKGVKVVVKISGQKHNKTERKHRKHKEFCKKYKERKLLEDPGNSREAERKSPSKKKDRSGESSSTSYLSPPDHLTPKQLKMLNSLFEQIENKEDEKGIPILKQYILRLLSMSRESIEELNVSSSDVSISSSLFPEEVLQRSIHEEENPSVCHVDKDNQVTSSLTHYDGVNLDTLRHHVNKYFENKLREENRSSKAPTQANELVSKYTELAKRYADRISSLAEMIGDMETSAAIKQTVSGNETSYLSLPSQVHGAGPLGNVGQCERMSPTFSEDGFHDRSWHAALSTNSPNKRATPFSEISDRISPPPFRPRPPPSMLNGRNRICTPHELSTIQEVETPSASQYQLHSQQNEEPPSREICIDEYHDTFDGIILSDEKLQDVNLSFLTNQSEEDIPMHSSSDSSIPDVMEELMKRGILTSPFEWAKDDHHKRKDDDLSCSQMADEEIRVILKESSPEDPETAFQNLGLGWAGATLRKTRRAGELSADSSSSPGGIDNRARIRERITSSTPENPNTAPSRLIPGNENDISTVKMSSVDSNSDTALTPPDVFLYRNGRYRHGNSSIGSLS